MGYSVAVNVLKHPDLLREVMAGLRLRVQFCDARAQKEIERGDEEQSDLWNHLGMRAQSCHDACHHALLKLEEKACHHALLKLEEKAG